MGRQERLYVIYYKIGALIRKIDESMVDFSKRLNKMYNNILTVIKSIETLSKITFSNVFDADFSLSLREIRVVTLVNMQEVSLEVESNIKVVDRLRFKPKY